MSEVEEVVSTNEPLGDDDVDGSASSSRGAVKSKEKHSKDKSKKKGLFKKKVKSDSKTSSKKDGKSKSKVETEEKEQVEEAGGDADSAKGSSVILDDGSSMAGSTVSKISSEIDENKPEKKRKKKSKFGVFRIGKSKKHMPAVESDPQAQSNADEPPISGVEDDDSGHVREAGETDARQSEVPSEKVDVDEVQETEQSSKLHSTTMVVQVTPHKEISSAVPLATVATDADETPLQSEEVDDTITSENKAKKQKYDEVRASSSTTAESSEVIKEEALRDQTTVKLQPESGETSTNQSPDEYDLQKKSEEVTPVPVKIPRLVVEEVFQEDDVPVELHSESETPDIQDVSEEQTANNTTAEDVVSTEMLQEDDPQLPIANEGKPKEEVTDENETKEAEKPGGKEDKVEEKEINEKESVEKEEATADESQAKEEPLEISKERAKNNDEVSPGERETLREQGDKKQVPEEPDKQNVPSNPSHSLSAVSEIKEALEKSMESSVSTTKRRTLFSLKNLCCTIL